MSEFHTFRPSSNREWDEAWNLVHRLDAARKGLSDHAGDNDGNAASSRPSPASAPGATPPIHVKGETAGVEPDDLAQAIADIERASAALRRADPAIESWSDRTIPAIQPLSQRSAWILIGVLWSSTVLIAAGLIFAMASLVG